MFNIIWKILQIRTKVSIQTHSLNVFLPQDYFTHITPQDALHNNAACSTVTKNITNVIILPKVTKVCLQLYCGFSRFSVEYRPLCLRGADGPCIGLVCFQSILEFVAKFRRLLHHRFEFLKRRKIFLYDEKITNKTTTGIKNSK